MGIYTRRDGPPSNGRGAVKLNQNIASPLNIFRDIANPFLHSQVVEEHISPPSWQGLQAEHEGVREREIE
jgi:hypothetical protein